MGVRKTCCLSGLSVHTFGHLGNAALIVMVKLARLSAVLVLLTEVTA